MSNGTSHTSTATGGNVLADGLDTLASIDMPTLDDSTLRGELLDVAAAANRAHAELLRRVDQFDRRQLAGQDGCRTTKTWLIACLGCSGPAAHRLVKAARLLRHLPSFAHAVNAGQVLPEQVQQLVRLAEQVGVDKLADVDDTLAEAAAALDVAGFELVCHRVQAHLNPDGNDPAADFAKRSLTLSPANGTTFLRGQLDPEGAAAVSAALDALVTPPTDNDPRTMTQRRADALVELARLHLAAGDLPTVGGQRPQIGMLVFPQALSPQTLATLAKRQGDSFAGARLRSFLTNPDTPPADTPPQDTAPEDTAPADPAPALDLPAVDLPAAGEASPADTTTGGATAGSTAGRLWRPGDGAGDGDQPTGNLWQPDHNGHPPPQPPVWTRPGWADPPWLDWQGPIPAEVAQRIACDADVFRIVMDPDTGMPLDLGRTHRLVPYWLRKALWARDRGCRWLGCTAPAQWTDAHHLDGWFDQLGETTIERLILACRYHHMLVHEGGWTIDLDPHTGQVHILRPGGIPYHLPTARTGSWTSPTTHA